MNCYFHTDQVAVATCQDCGIGLCKECASKYTPALCSECAGKRERAAQKDYEKAKQEHLQSAKDAFLKPIIFGSVVAGIVIVLGLVTCIITGEWSIFTTMLSIAVTAFFMRFGWNLSSFAAFSDNSNVMVGIISIVLRIALSFILGIPAFFWTLYK